MTQPIDPPWLAAHKAAQAKAEADAAARLAAIENDAAKATGRAPDGKWLPGYAPHGSGKAPGTPDKRWALRQMLNGHGEGIAQVVLDAAYAGNLDACQMILARVVSPLRPQGRQVKFRFDLSASLTEQAQSVVNACAEGELSVEEAQMLVLCLANAAGLKNVDLMEERIRALEVKADRDNRARFGAGMVVGEIDEKGNLK